MVDLPGIKVPYDLAIPELGMYPEKTTIIKDIGAPVFTAALFTITRTWKEPRCPLIDEWIKKLWYIYTIEYYSAIKRNKSESVLVRWMNLKPVIQSEVSQKEKNKYHVLTHIYGIQKNAIDGPIRKAATEMETQTTVVDTVGEGEGGMN